MDNMYDKMRRVLDIRQSESSHRAAYKAERSKQRLAHLIGQKFATTFIGALSYFEEEFGFLWGQNKAQLDRTKEEKEWYDRWQTVRTKILNNGNNQSRAIQNELKQYTIDWEGYKITLRGNNNEVR